MRAVILCEEGFQDQELIYPMYRLREQGYEVKLAIPAMEQNFVTGKYGIRIKGNCCFADLIDMMDDYGIVIVPGGWQCPERLRQNQAIKAYLVEANKHNMIIGAICHGPWVLASAGLAKGKKMTCFPGMVDDIVNAGATYVNDPVVVDGNIVTSPHYDNLPEFMATIITMLEADKPK